MYTLVADLETGDRSHAAAQPPAEDVDGNDSDESSSSCQLGNADNNRESVDDSNLRICKRQLCMSTVTRKWLCSNCVTQLSGTTVSRR
ncbi:hypothetical protein ANTRET_LOCUS6862 [Anthophora retusa]